MESMDLRKERHHLMQRVRNGGLIFYICAFATILNVVLYYVRFFVMMPVGLHTVQYWFVEHCDKIGISPALGIVFAVLAAAAVAAVGYLAREKHRYLAYSVGTALLALDVFDIFTPASNVVANASLDLMTSYDSAMILFFDVYAVILLIMGLRAMRRVNELDAKIVAEGLTPIDDKDDPVEDMTAEQKRQYESERKKKRFLARREQEESVVSIDPAAAWPEPVQNAKKAKAQRIAQEQPAQQDENEE